MRNPSLEPCLVIIALLALWGVGLFARGWWRPDEPREAALVHSMAVDPGKHLPTLGGRPFAEKPPLTYYLSALSVRGLGLTPAATRIPLYAFAALAFLALVSLTGSVAGSPVRWLGGLVFATFLLVYQTQIWLNCDALLILGVCLSLLGMYRGLLAADSRIRLRWYAVLHAGLSLAFFAKNLAAWLFPVTAMLTFLMWEKRWRELMRWELWLGALIPVGLAGLWILSLLGAPDGTAAIRVLFWNNLVGRVMAIDAAPQFDYAHGHPSWPGKYFVELPLYMLPWTAVGLAALHRAWTKVRFNSDHRSAWRFAVSATLPGLIVLSAAVTARGIYAAPAMAGIALLIALWVSDQREVELAGTRLTLSVTRVLITSITAIVFAATLVLQMLSREWTFVATLSLLACAFAMAGIWLPARRGRRPELTSTLRRLGQCYALVLSAGVMQLYLSVSQWQDLSKVADGVRSALGSRELVLWAPDETTVAWVDLFHSGPPARIFFADELPTPRDPAALLDYLQSHSNSAVLFLDSKHAWSRAEWQAFLRSGRTGPRPAGLDFIPSGVRQRLHVDYVSEAPGGRRYVLMSPE